MIVVVKKVIIVQQGFRLWLRLLKLDLEVRVVAAAAVVAVGNLQVEAVAPARRFGSGLASGPRRGRRLLPGPSLLVVVGLVEAEVAEEVLDARRLASHQRFLLRQPLRRGDVVVRAVPIVPEEQTGQSLLH